jgi:hypothetical protein
MNRVPNRVSFFRRSQSVEKLLPEKRKRISEKRNDQECRSISGKVTIVLK